MDGKLIAAILIVLFGLRLLSPRFRKSNKKHGINIHGSSSGHPINSVDYTCNDDSFYCSKSFSEFRQTVHLDALQHGEIRNTFGEITIDLTEIKHVKSDCTIHTQCNFGELDILVPKQFEVYPEIGTSFAATSVNAYDACAAA